MSHIIGIDVSKATLDCAYLRDLDQDKAKRKGCQNKVDCFESLITWAEALSRLPRQSLAFVIEPTNIYHEQLVRFLHSKGATVYLVNPGRVRKFAEGIGILSKNDVIDADLLARHGLMAKKLIVFEPAPQEISDLRSLLNRLDVLEKNLRRELNRQEKAGSQNQGVRTTGRHSIFPPWLPHGGTRMYRRSTSGLWTPASPKCVHSGLPCESWCTFATVSTRTSNRISRRSL